MDNNICKGNRRKNTTQADLAQMVRVMMGAPLQSTK